MKEFTPREADIIRRDWLAGRTAGEIGFKLDRTRQSILGKIHRMGLSRCEREIPRAYPSDRRRVFTLPEFEAGCRMPSFASITAADSAQRKAAEASSKLMLTALLRYGARHGLPNLSPGDCRQRLAS